MDLTSASMEFITHVFIFSVLAITSAICECPRDADQQAHQCVAKFSMVMPQPGAPGEFVHTGDKERVREACRDGTLMDAIHCQERIKQQCQQGQSKDAAHFLKSTMDIAKAKEGIRYFCNNINVYMEHADCIVQKHQEIQNCSREAQTRLKTLLMATQNIDAQLIYSCNFFDKATECMYISSTKCSVKAANLVRTVLELNRPPMCKGPTYSVVEGQEGRGNTASGLRSSSHAVPVGAAVLLTLHLFGSFLL